MVEVPQILMVLLPAVGHQRSRLAVVPEEGRPRTAGLPSEAVLAAAVVLPSAVVLPLAVVLPSAAC